MRETPYTPDEQRVCEYLQQLCNGDLGGGDDPIGFLIIQNEWWRHRVKELENTLKTIKENTSDTGSRLLASIHDVPTHPELGLPRNIVRGV